MDEESRQRASGLKAKPKYTKPLSTDCASISFLDLLGSDFSEDLVVSFKVIQNFLMGNYQSQEIPVINVVKNGSNPKERIDTKL